MGQGGQEPFNVEYRGSSDTREFYDREGWHREDGVLKDQALFGVRKDGPLKQRIQGARVDRLYGALASVGARLRLLECGCGGNPEAAFLPLCESYTGVDFSQTGLKVAGERLAASGVPHRLVNGDLCKLPFPEASFDAVYSAHAIYHIPDSAAQAAAFREALRVVRPGGIALFVLANPFPLAFPIRLARRCLAATPMLGRMLDRIRRRPPLPYLPMRLGWMRGVLRAFGEVRIEGHAIPSTWFAQNVGDASLVGRALWGGVGAAEAALPSASAYLGNYVRIEVRKARG